MNIRPLFDSLLTGLICLSFLTGTAVAQQPFGSTPRGAADQDRPTEDGPIVVRPSGNQGPRRSFEVPQDREPSQDQVVLMNSKYAGWDGVSGAASGARVGGELRGNWIMVDPNGRFEGSVIPAKGADVTGMNVFLMNMGRLVKQTNLDSNGRFEFNNVRQGAYALIGWGNNGLFAFGLNILGNNPRADGSFKNTVTATAFQNKTSINTDWIQFYAPRVSFRVYGRYQTGEGREDPKSLYGFEGLVSNLPKSIPATSISSHSVEKTADGRLVGRVHQLNSLNGRPVDVRTTKVLLLEGDDVVASTTTDNYGVFEFTGVPDGSYGLVAAGVDGVGMIAINVGTEKSVMNDAGEFAENVGNSIDFTLIPSETIGWLNNYATEVAYYRSILAPRPPIYDPQFNDPFPKLPDNRLCNSRGTTFKCWQSRCYSPTKDYRLGQGVILSAMAKEVQKGAARNDMIFDRAFYQNDIGPQFQNESPYASGAYGYGAYGGSAFGGQ